MTAPARVRWEPDEYSTICKYVELNTAHPTATEIAQGLGLESRKVTLWLAVLVNQERLRFNKRGEYFTPGEKDAAPSECYPHKKYMNPLGRAEAFPGMKECALESCGKRFTPPASNPGQRFHKAACHHESMRVIPEIECKNCGKIYQTSHGYRGRKYCSRDCYTDFLNKRRTT
jgi:hypothetical protein